MDCSSPGSSVEFSKQEYWSGMPFPSPGDLTNPGIEPRSPSLQADSLPSQPPEKPSSSNYENAMLSHNKYSYFCLPPLDHLLQECQLPRHGGPQAAVQRNPHGNSQHQLSSHENEGSRRASSTPIEPAEDCSLADIFTIILGDPPNQSHLAQPPPKS